MNLNKPLVSFFKKQKLVKMTRALFGITVELFSPSLFSVFLLLSPVDARKAKLSPFPASDEPNQVSRDVKRDSLSDSYCMTHTG